MQNYRNMNFAPATSQRSPAAPRRGPGPMVPQHPQHPQQPAQLNAAQLQAQRLEEIRRQDAARRISRKPTDREIPEELSGVIVGDGVERYQKLREVERKLDAVMMRKRLDISDNLQRRYTKREGVMRVWISNTADGQPWQVIEDGAGDDGGAFEFGAENSNATFRVKIEGRLLDESSEAEEGSRGKEKEAEDKAPPQKRPRFSHFFKAITVDFHRDPALGLDTIEWRKPQPGPQNPTYDPNSSEVSFDTLEFERKCDDEKINITINLVRDEKNVRYKLSPVLAEILDTEEDDRAGVAQGLWEYCRANNLQEDEDKRNIVCDDALRRVFREDTLYFPHVPDKVLPHLQPIPPLQLHYTIRADASYIKSGSPATVYDIRIPLPNPTTNQLQRFHNSKSHLATLQQIVKTDDDLALLVQKMHQSNAKRKFFDQLARDPAGFVDRWVRSQSRDLEVVLAEGVRGQGEDGNAQSWMRKGGSEGVWGSERAREAVGGMVSRTAGK